LLQMGLPAERWPNMPLFLRPPTTSIVGPGRTVRIPAMTQQFDWEIELAVVISRRLSQVSEAEAASGIAGYSVGIDFGCRDLLDRGSAIGADLVRAKAQDTMAPVGPVLMPAAFVADPQNLSLRLWVNGEQRQDGSTANMLYSIHEQIATISRYITLEPGDLIFTGSPAGSARTPDQYLRAGDRIKAEIAEVGVLEVELYRGADAAARPSK
jgi:2-keto-4-pentenoate hydratase/2-oxohepta-3-ene-1,7-dioic acid hydratase in catechol pathway